MYIGDEFVIYYYMINNQMTNNIKRCRHDLLKKFDICYKKIL